MHRNMASLSLSPLLFLLSPSLFIYLYLCVYIYIYIHACMCVYRYVYTFIHPTNHPHTHKYIYIDRYIHAYIHKYIYIYIHTHTSAYIYYLPKTKGRLIIHCFPYYFRSMKAASESCDREFYAPQGLSRRDFDEIPLIKTAGFEENPDGRTRSHV